MDMGDTQLLDGTGLNMEGLMLRQGAFWRLPEVRKVSGRWPPISGAICSLVPVLFAQPNPTQSALDQSFPDLSRMPLREMAFERRKTLTAWSIAANEATEETRRGSSKGPRSVQALNVNKQQQCPTTTATVPRLRRPEVLEDGRPTGTGTIEEIPITLRQTPRLHARNAATVARRRHLCRSTAPVAKHRIPTMARHLFRRVGSCGTATCITLLPRVDTTGGTTSTVLPRTPENIMECRSTITGYRPTTLRIGPGMSGRRGSTKVQRTLGPLQAGRRPILVVPWRSPSPFKILSCIVMVRGRTSTC